MDYSIHRTINNYPDKEYVQLIRDQLELYAQKIELMLKDKEEVKSLLKIEMPTLEKAIQDSNAGIEILKQDRTKDQTAIFELERKIGFLQVHYTYDKAKLMGNAEVIVSNPVFRYWKSKQ